MTAVDPTRPTLDPVFPGDGEMARRCRSFDWAATPLGPVGGWPESLRTIAATVLATGFPGIVLWGPDLIQIYNDGYVPVLGVKHPWGLGLPTRECWPEAWAFNEPIYARVFRGETVTLHDQRYSLRRNGPDAPPDDVYITLSYTPVRTEGGEVGGVCITLFDTTDQIAGRRAQAEREQLLATLEVEQARLAAAFQQSPSFLAILRGADNVFEQVNAAYEQIIGHGRNVVGKPLFEALPETRGQGFDGYLDRVRATGQPLVFRDLPVMLERTRGAPLEERFIDITYLPLVEADGSHDAVIAHGTDVTAQVRARRDVERLLAGSERARADAEVAQAELQEANDRLQDQALELELTNQQLQDNAVELEAQTEELQATAAQLEERTEEAETARHTVTAIVEAVTDGFVAFDRGMRYTYVNRRAGEMWGLSPATLLGKTPEELWPRLGRSPVLEMCRRVLASGRAEATEDHAPTLGVRIEARAYPLSDGGLVLFFADVTGRRRAEDAAIFLAEASRVLASSADYQTTLSNLARAAVPRLADWCAVDVLPEPDAAEWPPRIERVAVIHQDPAKVTLAATLTTSFPQDWSRDTGTPAVIRTREPMFLPDVTDAMLVGGAQNDAHLAMLRALHFRSIMIVPLVARDRVLGALTLVMAESERRFTESDLAVAVDLGQRAGVALDNARLLRNAAEANAAKTEFLRTVSHELRQPLNAMRGYLDLWQAGIRGELPAAMREDVARLARNQEHLGVLIEDLLSFTRLDAGRLEVERVPIPIAPIFAALEAMVRPQMLARGLLFSHDVGDPAVAARGDRDRVVQICLNLLTNAMRATPPGGRVTLGCVADEGAVTITVSDTGVGIPPNKLDAVFDAFTQLGRALNAPKEGAGLGLAISRGLAEAMHGTLTVRSALGEGSTFSLRLPRATGDAPVATVTPEKARLLT